MATAPVSSELRDPLATTQGTREAGARAWGGGRITPHAARRRILLTTEGTYPYIMGGVSSWCDLLVNSLTEFDWQVMPIVAPHGRPATFALPPHATEIGPVEVWSEDLPKAARGGRGDRRSGVELPSMLVRNLLSWEGSTDAVTAAWVWCRRHPGSVRRAFRSARGWASFLDGLREVLAERIPEAGTPPAVDLVEAATLYQTLYWVARTAAVPTPPSDALHVTAAGWAAIPAVVHKALHGTPMVLTEHGVYVREAYLAAARNGDSAGSRFAATRLARGLARTAYAAADVVSPVTDANAYWEMGLGIDPSKILVLYNGLQPPSEPTPPPGTQTVVSVGRLDPLKDTHTMLRVAAHTTSHLPAARFLHYGPVPRGEEIYGRSCVTLHERLGLGDRFRFMGPTADPTGVVRDSDVVLMTSISEGLPMAILEAMGQARPVVSTGVGGVPEVVRGCGLVCAPGDDHALATAVVLLLRNPELAWRLGRRGHSRLGRLFNETACIDGYRELLGALTSALPDEPVEHLIAGVRA
jgi:glycosyltransferase involved in cell wall biosynthesis